MKIELHAPRTFARVVVGIVAGDPNARIHLPNEKPIRRVIVLAMRALQLPGVPPIVALDSREHSAPGHALSLRPGERLELAGEVGIFGNVRDAFAGEIDWGARVDPVDQRIAIEFVTVDGHRLT